MEKATLECIVESYQQERIGQQKELESLRTEIKNVTATCEGMEIALENARHETHMAIAERDKLTCELDECHVDVQNKMDDVKSLRE